MADADELPSHVRDQIAILSAPWPTEELDMGILAYAAVSAIVLRQIPIIGYATQDVSLANEGLEKDSRMHENLLKAFKTPRSLRGTLSQTTTMMIDTLQFFDVSMRSIALDCKNITERVLQIQQVLDKDMENDSKVRAIGTLSGSILDGTGNCKDKAEQSLKKAIDFKEFLGLLKQAIIATEGFTENQRDSAKVRAEQLKADQEKWKKQQEEARNTREQEAKRYEEARQRVLAFCATPEKLTTLLVAWCADFITPGMGGGSGGMLGTVKADREARLKAIIGDRDSKQVRLERCAEELKTADNEVFTLIAQLKAIDTTEMDLSKLKEYLSALTGYIGKMTEGWTHICSFFEQVNSFAARNVDRKNVLSDMLQDQAMLWLAEHECNELLNGVQKLGYAAKSYVTFSNQYILPIAAQAPSQFGMSMDVALAKIRDGKIEKDIDQHYETARKVIAGLQKKMPGIAES